MFFFCRARAALVGALVPIRAYLKAEDLWATRAAATKKGGGVEGCRIMMMFQDTLKNKSFLRLFWLCGFSKCILCSWQGCGAEC